MKTIRRVVIVLLSVMIAAGSLPAAFAYGGSMTAGSDGLDPAASVQDIVSSMSTRQKITQCLMMDFREWIDENGKVYDMTVLDPEVANIIADYQFGSIILFSDNIKNTGETLQLTKDMQQAVTGGGGLPLLIATDQEGGIVYRLGSGTALPGNMALGATGDPANAKIAGEIVGRELGSVGINTTLAPVIDVNNEPNNSVIGLRSYSDDPNVVGEFGSAFISGLNEYNIIGCAKHYPGHGDTSTDSHYGLPVVDKSLKELMQIELLPYYTAISQGVDMVMTAHILYPQVDSTVILSDETGKEEQRPATMSYIFLTEILRGDMGFDGVVVTDAMNMAGIDKAFSMEQSSLEAIKAGSDLVCMPVTGIYDKDEVRARLDSIISYIEADLNSSKEGSLTQARLDEAVTRVLTLKKNKGILDYNADAYTAEKALATVGSAENRALEREIAAKAVTLIRNDNDILPYKADADTKILLMCPYDNEKAQMVMGVNRAKMAGNVPADAEVRVYRYSGDDYSIKSGGELKEAIDWADFVIINSEVSGSAGMSLDHWTSLGPVAVTGYCRATGKHSVVMSVDKPYDVQLYPDADAVLAVYGDKGSSLDVTTALLDGVTEDENACGPNITAGIEVLFGNYKASGRLPVNINVFDINTRRFTNDIRYSSGYGLSYEDKAARPGQAKIKKVKTGRRYIKVTASASPAKKNASRYQLAYRYKGSSKWRYRTAATKTITVKSLKKGKVCYVKLRAVSSKGGRTVYGKWSRTVRSAKIK